MKKTGLKFGLIGSASKLKSDKSGGSSLGKQSGLGTSKPPPRRRPPGATAVFDANSDEEGEEEGSKEDLNGVAAVNRRLVAISEKQEKLAKKEYEEALAANPSVFDYDRAYDSMKESRESKASAAAVAREKEKRKPKYIGNLLQQAKLRSIQSDRVYERKLQKEREEQDKLEGEATMKFVTSAYKKKLIEQQKWEVQQKLEEDREVRDDVTKTGMKGFYSSLLTKNIAMGGDVETSAHSAFTAGSKRFEATDRYDLQEGKETPPGGGESSGDGAGARGGADDGIDESDESGASGKAGGVEAGDDDGAPSARLVDPRASSTSKRSRESDSGAREEAKGSDARRTSERGESSDSPSRDGKRAGIDMSSGDAGDAGDGPASRPENTETSVDESGFTRRGASKRPRQNDETVPETGHAEGSRGELEGIDASSRRRDSREGDRTLAAESGTFEDQDKAKKASEAKARKEATIKAARERYLARKKAS